MMQKKIAAGLAVLLAAGTILGGCGESGAAGNDSVSDAAGNEAAALTEAKTTPYGRYPETITYTLAKMTGVNNSNLPEGETYEDNAYTRLIREIINVQNEDVYENYGDTYNVGISTMIATGNIADIMVVDQKTMNAMQKNDQLADLTEVYANCASDRIKDIYASYGEEILQGCTFDGKLMAFPETNISDGPNLLWVRKDWMEKLGLSVPETIDDVKHIALTFAEENPANQEMGNIGLAVSTTLYGGTGISSEYGMNLIFASFGAYPGRWLTDAETATAVLQMPLPETIPRAHPRQEAQAHLLPTQQRKRKLPQPLPYGLRQRIRQATAVSGCRPCAISLQRSIHPGTLPLITVYAQRAMQKIP